ncbi:hypothetical protein J3F84DRAFT_238980 [Trichoderma pleuroticola]
MQYKGFWSAKGWLKEPQYSPFAQRTTHSAQAKSLPFFWPLTSPRCIRGDPVAARESTYQYGVPVRTIGRQDRLRGAGCPGTTVPERVRGLVSISGVVPSRSAISLRFLSLQQHSLFVQPWCALGSALDRRDGRNARTKDADEDERKEARLENDQMGEQTASELLLLVLDRNLDC